MGFLDSYDDPEFGGAHRAKKERDRGRRRLKRVAARAPEVVVKVTGNAKAKRQLGAHISYMTRKGTLPLHTSDGEQLVGHAEVSRIPLEWQNDAKCSHKTGKQLRTRLSTNIVLSVPEGKPDRVLAAAQDFARTNFENHDWVMALHTDTDHPHAHLTVRNLGRDEKRLHIPKGKPQQWRESFAASLRTHGIQAEASHRAERGVVRKSEKQSVRHLRARQTPDVYKSAMREADNRRRDQDTLQPWRKQINDRQQCIRAQWRKAIEQERINGDPALAQAAFEFLGSMPAVETRSDQMVRFLQEREAAKAKSNYGPGKREKHTARNRFDRSQNEQDGPER